MPKNLKLKIFSLLALFGLNGCNPNYDNLFKENNQKFESHRSKLKLIIISLEKIHLKNWDRAKSIIIQVASLHESIKDDLVNIGVGSIELSPNIYSKCDKDYIITLNVIEGWNISSLKVVKLIYSPCEKKAHKNYHSHDGYNIDIWGQGESWLIFSDTDFI